MTEVINNREVSEPEEGVDDNCISRRGVMELIVIPIDYWIYHIEQSGSLYKE